MAVLANPKHERFAQAIAKGKSQADAYVEAGYKAIPITAKVNGCKLLTNANIKARVKELQEHAAEKTEITIASLSQELMRVAQKAERIDEPSGLSVWRLAIMDLAKLNGLIPDGKKSGDEDKTVRIVAHGGLPSD